jgi:hypothetical protein
VDGLLVVVFGGSIAEPFSRIAIKNSNPFLLSFPRIALLNDGYLCFTLDVWTGQN